MRESVLGLTHNRKHRWVYLYLYSKQSMVHGITFRQKVMGKHEIVSKHHRLGAWVPLVSFLRPWQRQLAAKTLLGPQAVLSLLCFG
jgi:hypothetical protein